MGYKLEKPYTDIQRADFVVEHQGLNYYEDDNCIIMYSDSEKIENGESIDISETPEYISEQTQKEAERIAKLHLTRGDVFRGLLQAKQVTREQLRALILAMPDGLAKEMALIDFDEALEFYRGNALIDTIGAQLGITVEQMNRFFETNNYTELTREEIAQSA